MSEPDTIKIAEFKPKEVPYSTCKMVETSYRAWLKRRGYRDNSHLSSGFRRVANARSKRRAGKPTNNLPSA